MIALDSNILAYAEGVNTEERRVEATRAIALLGTQEIHVPAQALGELFNVLIRKQKTPPSVARAKVQEWIDTSIVIPTRQEILEAAMDITILHQLQIWDAVILASAEASGCSWLLSEDMQHGFRWGDATVVNPFTEDGRRILQSIGE